MNWVPAATPPNNEQTGKGSHMDEEMWCYLEAMEGRLMACLNNSEERILNRLDALERDFTNTKGFLVSDSLTSGRRWHDLEVRVSKLERGEC